MPASRVSRAGVVAPVDAASAGKGAAAGAVGGSDPSSEPRWLDDEEQQVWRTYLAATQLLADRLDQELQRDSGIPHTYYEVLVRLSEVPGRRLRMSDLAERSLSSRSRLSHAVTRLEEAGWVRREMCPSDRRGQFAVLTDEGFAALAAAAPRHVDGVRAHLFDHLSPAQVRQLGEICALIADHLQQLKGDGAVLCADEPTGAGPLTD